MEKGKNKAITYAFLAAVFYAVNVPVSKILLREVGPTTMAALLYLGAGIGVSLLSLVNKKDRDESERLSKKDLPFVFGMIVLDIAAPRIRIASLTRTTTITMCRTKSMDTIIHRRNWNICQA